jgi:GNAT superfamily N-acetyltransferase
VTIREAEPGDVEALARLLVALYDHEVPGMLRGPYEKRLTLTRRLVTAAPLGQRYVVEHDSRVAATGSLATTERPRPSTPPSAILGAPLIVGPVNGVLTFIGGIRGMATMIPGPSAQEALIHSVVVSEHQRGGGVGRALLAFLEDKAREAGKSAAVLQVVASNAGARRFYRAAGYVEEPARLGVVQRLLAFPSVVMRKQLT